MRYAEKVMLHQMVQQTATDKRAYTALTDSADTRLWFVGRHRVSDILTDAIQRHIFENQVISKIADSERSELASKKDVDEEASRLYNAEIDLLGEVVGLKRQMTDILKSIRHSVTLWKCYSSEDINMMIDLAGQLIPKLRDLSDVAGLLEKYDKPF